MACCFPFGSLGSTTVCGNCKGDQNTQRKRVEKSCQRLVRSHPHQDKHLPRSHRPPGSAHLHAQLEKGYTNAVRMEGNTYRLGVTGGLTCTHEEQPKSSGTEAEHNRAGAGEYERVGTGVSLQLQEIFTDRQPWHARNGQGCSCRPQCTTGHTNVPPPDDLPPSSAMRVRHTAWDARAFTGMPVNPDTNAILKERGEGGAGEMWAGKRLRAAR